MKTLVLLALFFSAFSSAQTRSDFEIKIDDSLERIAHDSTIGDTIRLRAHRKILMRTIYSNVRLGFEKLKAYETLAVESNNMHHIIRVNSYKSFGYQKLSKYDSSLYYSFRALDLSLTYDHQGKIGNVYMDIGNTHEVMGNLDSALFYYKKALTIEPESSKNIYKARCNINLGGIYEKQGNYKKSIANFEEALSICENHGLTGFLAAVYRSLGNVNTSIKEYDLAQNYYSMSLFQAEKFSNNNTKFQALERWANMKYKAKEYEESIEKYVEAIKVAESIYGPMDLANAKCGLARVFIEINENKQAKRLIDESLEILQKENVEAESYVIYITAGVIYYNSKIYSESQKLLENGYQLAKTSNDIEYIELAANHLHLINKRNGNIKKSLFYLEESQKQREILHNSGKIKDVISLELNLINEKQKITDSLTDLAKIERINAKHESEIKQKKSDFKFVLFSLIAILLIATILMMAYRQKRKQTIILGYKNEIIKTALKDKEVLLAEVNHRVKNNMQMISGLLQLKAKEMNNVAAKEALLDSQSRIHSMSLAHQKLYESSNFERINITEYLQDILESLTPMDAVENHNKFRLIGEQILANVNQSQTVGFIMHELITNSLKHAWNSSEKKNIIIKLKESNGMVQIDYSDNGAGLSKSISLETARSFGLKMINALVKRQLMGTIEIVDFKSTHFRINFKIV